MLFEVMNSIACAVLLACMLPVATIVDPRKHPGWVLLMLVVEVVFFMNIVAPFAPAWPLPVAWQTAMLTTPQAICVVVLRKKFWLFVRAQFEALPVAHPIRRVRDVEELAKGGEDRDAHPA